MFKILTLASVLLFMSPKAQVGEAQTRFQAGNELYQQGYHLEALAEYQAALGTGYSSAELYYNLGNTFYKLGDIGHCILFLERAKKLAPGDPDILFNLEMANLHVVDKVLVPPPFILNRIYNRIRDMYPLQHLGTITMIVYLLFILLLVSRILLRGKTRMVLLYAMVLVFIFLATFSVMFVDRVHRDLHQQQAVVLTEKVDIKSSPSAKATDVFVLHEGVLVKVTAETGDFLKIELADGKVGWINKATVEII